MSSTSSEQTALIRTNDDAAESRASAVARGYLTDPFASLFAKHPFPRPPLINRGISPCHGVFAHLVTVLYRDLLPLSGRQGRHY